MDNISIGYYLFAPFHQYHDVDGERKYYVICAYSGYESVGVIDRKTLKDLSVTKHFYDSFDSFDYPVDEIMRHVDRFLDLIRIKINPDKSFYSFFERARDKSHKDDWMFIDTLVREQANPVQTETL